MASSKHTRSNGDSQIAAAQRNSSTALAGNEVYQQDLAAEIAKLTDGLVKGDIGFPPYWRPKIAKGFRGIVLYRDERANNFPRYHLENTGPTLDCLSGPAAESEVIEVPRGSVFTISAWAALPLDQYIGVEVAIIATGKREGMPATDESEGKPRDMWEWTLYVSEENKRMIASQRTEDLQFLSQAVRDGRRKALVAIAAASSANRQLGNGKKAVNTTGVSA